MRAAEEYKYWYGAVDRPSPTIVFRGARIRSILAGRLSALIPHLRS